MIQWIDPMIGVDGPGECLPGPYCPLGLVRLSPDTVAPHKTNGYRTGDPILRFSHTHVSGTGGMSRYGNIGVTPFTGAFRDEPGPFTAQDETASCGYYAVTAAESGIRCELTAMPRTGIHRYTFPAGQQAHLLLDAGCVIQPAFSGFQRDPNGWPPHSTGGFLEQCGENALCGRGDYRGGWGHNSPYSIFFYAESDVPFARSLIVQSGMLLRPGEAGTGPNLRAVLAFGEQRQINLRVGISYVSVAKARASLRRETAGRSFEELRQSCIALWEPVLTRARVEGGTPTQQRLFATLMTRLYCMPGDLGTDDEFPGWHSGVRHFTDYYCVWDSVRNANSLFALFDPALAADFLNCLLDVGEQTGWVPDAWISGHSAFRQGGCSAAVLAGEAALKNLPGIDYPRALRILRRDALALSPEPYYHGRYGDHYRARGYVSAETPQCVSRHLEYAYQDWCLARLAQKAGDRSAAAEFSRTAQNLWNLWRDDLCSFAPRDRAGHWLTPYHPDFARRDCWNDPYFYEGSGREWSWSAQQDFPELVRRMGGADAFRLRLDEFFSPQPVQRPTPGEDLSAYARYHSKETLLHVPYLYHYCGRPDLSTDCVRTALDRCFSDQRYGLHDNEDMGCQSAFYLASALGLYPLYGQDLYWLTTPLFSRSAVQLGSPERVLTIEAPGVDATNRYIVGATLNGRPLERAWLRHAEIAQGGTLALRLAPQPAGWGTSVPGI